MAKISLVRKLRICCATCLTRSYWNLYKIVHRVCCRSLCRTFLLRSYGCFNSSKFQWVACPDSGAGTRPKRHAVFKFPFLAVMLVPGQQRLTVFLCPPPTATSGVVAGTGMTQAGSPVVFYCFLDGGVFLGSLVCDLRCVAGLRMICRVSRNVLDSEMHLRCVAGGD